MYGNGWNDNNNGSFTSTSVMNAYSPLDLYLMGMIPKEQVPPMLLIDNPAINKAAPPSIGSGISGTATTVSIADIVAAEGERLPNVSNSQKQFNVGYILLVRHGDTVGQAAQALDMVRKGFAGRFAEMTHGIGGIANVPATLEVAIDTPLDNASITGPTLHVTGTVLNSSGVETGVVVNGVTATLSGVRFTANNIDLLPGTNSIAVMASDVNGRTAMASRTVTAHSGNSIRVRPSVESGVAPLNLTLTVESPFSIGSSSLYTSGPIGVSQLPGSTPTSYLMRLPVEGSYTFTVLVNGPDGQNYTDSVEISVLPRRQLDHLLRSKWQAVTTDLAGGETTAALAHFTPPVRPKYQALFAEVAPLLPSILATHQGAGRRRPGRRDCQVRIDDARRGRTARLRYCLYQGLRRYLADSQLLGRCCGNGHRKWIFLEALISRSCSDRLVTNTGPVNYPTALERSRMNSHKFLLGCGVLLIVLGATPSFAYRAGAHRAINDSAITQKLLTTQLAAYFSGNFGYTNANALVNGYSIADWFKNGGAQEDQPGLRMKNHFLDPVANSGFSGSLFGMTSTGEPAPSGHKKRLPDSPPGGAYSWQDARYYFYTALTSDTNTVREQNLADSFRALGQVMHLLAEMSLPDNTRDTSRIDSKTIEPWLERVLTSDDPLNTQYAARLNSALNSPIAPDPSLLQQAGLFPAAPLPVANLFDFEKYSGSNPAVTNQRSHRARRIFQRKSLQYLHDLQEL